MRRQPDLKPELPRDHVSLNRGPDPDCGDLVPVDCTEALLCYYFHFHLLPIDTRNILRFDRSVNHCDSDPWNNFTCPGLSDNHRQYGLTRFPFHSIADF